VEFLDHAGCRLAYVRRGQGRPIIFVPGGACTHRDWDEQLTGLSDAFTVVAIDARGHGASAVDDPKTCTVENMAADINALADYLDLGPAVLVGHSFSCRLVLQAAFSKSDTTAGVVLVDGSRVWTGTREEAVTSATAIVTDIRGFFENIFDAPAFFVRADAENRKRIHDSMVAVPDDVLVALTLSTGPWDAEDFERVVAGLKVPLLALQSTFWNETTTRRSLHVDEKTTPWLDLLRTLKPDTQMTLIPEIGHFAMLEAPEIVNAEIRRFATTE
jgi:pimeloyl-ACP methyl ester carboxylesterase